MRELFAAEEPKWILLKPRVETHWPAFSTILEGHTGYINSIAFSYDSSIIASSSWDGIIRLWRTSTGDCIQELESRNVNKITLTAFSHDAKLLASGSFNGKIHLWSVSTGHCLHIFEGHTGSVHSITFSSDSVFIASASNDETIRLWHADSRNCVQELQDCRETVAIAFAQDSSLLASASKDGIIRLQGVETGKCIGEVKVDVSSVRLAAFSYDLALLASTSTSDGYSIQLWRTDTGECVRTLECFGNLWLTAFSVSSDFIASASNDGMIQFWCLDTGDCVRVLEVKGDLGSGAFSGDLSLVAVPWIEKTICLWPINVNSNVQEAEAQRDVEEQRVSGGEITSIAFSHNSALVASASYGGRIVSLWCAKTGRWIRELCQLSWIWSIAFSDDSLLLASASRDELVRIWCTATGQCLHELHHPAATAIVFSNDSSLIASATWGEIWLWRADTGGCVQKLDKKPGRRRLNACHVAFSHNSALVASSLSNASIQVLCVATGTHVQTLQGHGYEVTSIAFSRDSTLVAAAAEGGTVRLWRVDTGDCLQIIRFGANILKLSPANLSITSDNSKILTEFGSIVIDYTATVDAQIPAHFLGLGVRCDYSWITWNNHNILRLPVELGACGSTISGNTIAIGCRTGRVIIIRLSTEELSKLYNGVNSNRIA